MRHPPQRCLSRRTVTGERITTNIPALAVPAWCSLLPSSISNLLLLPDARGFGRGLFSSLITIPAEVVMTRKLKFVVLLLVSFLAWAQAPSASTPAIEARADAMLKQLSLEEKIDLIGGVDEFYIREIKHIGLPALKMADGPFGVRNYGPPRPSAVWASPLHGTGNLLSAWARSLAR